MAPRSTYPRLLPGTGGILLLAACLTMSLSGCSPTPPPVAAPPRIHRFDPRELAELGGYVEDVDDGRLSLAPPVEWRRKLRDKAYVAQFVLTAQSPFPRITVHVRKAGFRAPRNVTDENSLLQFLDQIKASLDRDSVKTLEGPQPLILGDVPCVRYVILMGFHMKSESGAEDRSFRGDREVVETLTQGRIYSVILDTYEGKIEDYRRDAYAVVAGLRFQHPKSTDDEPGLSSDGQKEAKGKGLESDATQTKPKSP
jgi:hypothetical protein